MPLTTKASIFPCGFCKQRFSSKTELTLHQAHEHPQAMISSYEYNDALLRRYPT